MRLAIITTLLLTLGCASAIRGYGIEYIAVIGNGSYHCTEDNTGPDCLSGGEISENAAGVAKAAADKRGDDNG